MAQEDHWLPGFNFNVKEWDAKGQTNETFGRDFGQIAAAARAATAKKVEICPLANLPGQVCFWSAINCAYLEQIEPPLLFS